MQKKIAGLSTKVLNERLQKLRRFGIIQRTVFAEIPPRVEYRLTTFGRRFDRVLRQVQLLQRDLELDR